MLAAKDPEWFEKIDSISPSDIIAVATEFTKQTVDKVQHGEQLQLFCSICLTRVRMQGTRLKQRSGLCLRMRVINPKPS